VVVLARQAQLELHLLQVVVVLELLVLLLVQVLPEQVAVVQRVLATLVLAVLAALAVAETVNFLETMMHQRVLLTQAVEAVAVMVTLEKQAVRE
jgi:hypothetical protein